MSVVKGVKVWEGVKAASSEVEPHLLRVLNLLALLVLVEVPVRVVANDRAGEVQR